MPDLSVSPAVDLLAGLTILFFFFAIISAAINEVAQTLLNARGKYLSEAIRRLLGDEDQADLFFDHWRIRHLSPETWWLRKRTSKWGRRIKRHRRPSYIPSRAFALSILDTASPAEAPAFGAGLLREARKTVDRIGIAAAEGGSVVAATAEQRHDALRAELERAFEEVMSRASGWYKRYVQWWLIAIAAALAFGLNINAVTVGRQLWQDGAVRPVVVQQAIKANNTDEIPKKLPLPIGHTKENPFRGWYGVLGCLVTVAGLSLGAPFWFDVLNRFSHLRSAGDREGVAGSGPSP